MARYLEGVLLDRSGIANTLAKNSDRHYSGSCCKVSVLSYGYASPPPPQATFVPIFLQKHPHGAPSNRCDADEVEKQGVEEPRDAGNDIFADDHENLEDTPGQHAVERNGAKGLGRRAGYSLSLSLSRSAVLSTA